MPLNKADTLLRLKPQTSQTADLSQYGRTLTIRDIGGYLDPNTDLALDGTGSGAEFSFRFDASNTTGGYLLYHGDTGTTNYTYRLTLSGGTFQWWYSAGLSFVLTMPGVTASTDTYMACVNVRPNPLTTGASDAMLTEITIYNETTGDWLIEQLEHIVSSYAGSGSDVFSYNGRWTGSSLVSDFTGTLYDIRIGERFKSSTECAIDWSNYSPSSPTSGENQADPFPAIEGNSEIGDGGNAAGPAYQVSGAQVRDCARRLMSPIQNVRYHLPEKQGRTNLVRTTLNSRDEVYLIQGTEPGAGNPGHGDGPSGFPEVCREFGTVSKLCFEESTGSVPNFITDLQGSAFSISTWVRPDSFPNDMVIAGLTGGGGSSGALNDCAVLTVTSSNTVKFSWQHSSASTGVSGTSTATLSAGTWHHIAVTGTVNGGNYDIELFIDGTSDLTFSGTIPDLGSSSTWQVGRRDNAGSYSEYFEGGICEYKIVGRVLTDNEITFEAGRGQGYLLAGGKGGWSELAHWQFRQPSNGYSPARAFLDVDLGGNTYKAHLDTLIRRPLHRMAGKFQADVLAGVHFTQPPGTAETVDAVSVAIVATNRQPGKVTIGGPPPKTVYGTATITGTLERVEFDDLTLPRDADGQCWFYLASRIGAGSPSQHTAVQFDSCQIVPYSETPSTNYPFPFAAP